MGDLAKLNARDYGAQLRHRRISMGLSRQKLSDIADVSVTSLSKYERNISIPNDFTQAKIENAFSEMEARLMEVKG